MPITASLIVFSANRLAS